MPVGGQGGVGGIGGIGGITVPSSGVPAWVTVNFTVGHMIKNTAGQKVGAQLVSAADGSAFTGAVTVSVTGDAGTQATGSVGAGACTHEGNGYHTYAPAQAETNYDVVAFTFTGTGAIPVTVQIYTITGDAFARLGAPAGASVSADVAAVKAETASILTDTAEIGAAGAGLTALASAAALAAADAKLDTIDDFLDTEIAAILADTGTTLDDLVDDLEARLTQALADKLTAHAAGILTVVIGVGSTTTAVVFSTVNGAAPSAVDDYYNGATLVYTSGALAGQRVSINDYTGATTTATTSASTGAPANGVTAIIV